MGVIRLYVILVDTEKLFDVYRQSYLKLAVHNSFIYRQEIR